MTDKEYIQALKDAMAEMSWFMAHSFGCEVEQTEVCTCGMATAKKQARKLWKNYENTN